MSWNGSLKVGGIPVGTFLIEMAIIETKSQFFDTISSCFSNS